jgi:hypothetical protein
MSGEDKYYENDHGQRFVRKTAHYFRNAWGAMGVKFFELYVDGLWTSL